MKAKTNKKQIHKNHKHKNNKSKLNKINKNNKNLSKLRKNKTKSILKGGEINLNPLKVISFYLYKLINKITIIILSFYNHFFFLFH